ncbi:MAG: hypothetical protein H7281_11420 [Bacteriovorax sp.]|nr:hypothetical protein [Bacteriovorax sp.]
MKNVKSLLFSLAFTTLASSTLFAADLTVAPGKAVELSCHRLERLVTLGKVEDSFLSKLSSLQITLLQPTKPTDPSYKVVASQVAGADGSSKQVEMMLDATGKGIAQNVKAGTEAQNAPVWSDKNAADLVENSLHYILESNNADAKPFVSGLTSLKLIQVKNDQGQIMARVVMLSKDSAKKFEVTLKEDGTVDSANLIDNAPEATDSANL